MKHSEFGIVRFIALVWHPTKPRQLGINLTGLKLGQTKLSARFNEFGQQPIATLDARQVMQVLAGYLRKCDVCENDELF